MLNSIDNFMRGFYESGTTFFQGFGAVVAGGLLFKAFDAATTEQHKSYYLTGAIVTVVVFVLLHLRYRKVVIEQPQKTQQASFNKNTTVIQEGTIGTSAHQEANNNEGGSIHQK